MWIGLPCTPYKSTNPLGAAHITFLANRLKSGHTRSMPALHMITFRCDGALFKRLEEFAQQREIDRTSVLKLALHYYLNCLGSNPPS